MGARASQEPRARARVGLRVLLPVLLLALLLALVAPGAQGARGRGAADKNSHRRATSSFSQSLSSLFGEDNVRAAQKVGGAPAVTLPGPETVGGGALGLGTVAACCSRDRARPPGARDARALPAASQWSTTMSQALGTSGSPRGPASWAFCLPLLASEISGPSSPFQGVMESELLL